VDDLSLHVLDIIENSVAAGATEINIQISEDIAQNILTIEITDNGKGMDKEKLNKVLDPFYTTKTVRRVGLGLSMLAQATKEAGGDCDVRSQPGRGTRIKAKFVYDHIDRKPLGDMSDTIAAFIAGSGDRVNLTYRHRKCDKEFTFSTAEIKEVLEDVAISHPEVISFVKKEIQDGLKSISKRSKT
jgi:hypothetical protein